MQKFTLDCIVYGISDNNNSIFRNDKTIGYLFENSGNCPLQINNIRLNSGDVFKTFEPLCEDLTRYKVNFITNNQGLTPCVQNFAQLTAIIYSKND
jgi:hypothetical protein